MTSQLQLLPSQVAHADRLRAIMRVSAVALDFSMLGAGKTYTASHLMLDPGLRFRHALVIAPLSVKPKWLQMGRAFGVPIVEVISFCSLRSVRGRQPNHGMLSRRDGGSVEFTATPAYRMLVDEGVLLVIDEVQNIKNVSAQFEACRAMVAPIVDAFALGRPSRALMLSGSPIDRQEQAVTLMRTMGVMRCPELTAFNPGTRTLEWRGMQQVEDHCRSIDDDKVTRLRGRPTAYQKLPDAHAYCYALFQGVLKPEYASSMPVPCMPWTVSKANAFYEVHDAAEHAALSLGVEALANACCYNNIDRSVNLGQGGGIAALRALMSAMQQIEAAKVGTFARIADGLLGRPDDTRKVVMCVGYSATVRALCTALAQHRPLVLTGSTTMAERARILALFQRPDSEHRLLIGNLTVCSTGIDLDDKDGRFPRSALVSPSYNTITLYQFGHRFLRADSRSSADVKFVYGKHAAELNVINALSRKSTVMKQTTSEQHAAGIVFPGDHSTYVEDGETPLAPYIVA